MGEGFLPLVLLLLLIKKKKHPSKGARRRFPDAVLGLDCPTVMARLKQGLYPNIRSRSSRYPGAVGIRVLGCGRHPNIRVRSLAVLLFGGPEPLFLFLRGRLPHDG
jgi:hypothetical protein